MNTVKHLTIISSTWHCSFCSRPDGVLERGVTYVTLTAHWSMEVFLPVVTWRKWVVVAFSTYPADASDVMKVAVLLEKKCLGK